MKQQPTQTLQGTQEGHQPGKTVGQSAVASATFQVNQDITEIEEANEPTVVEVETISPRDVATEFESDLPVNNAEQITLIEDDYELPKLGYRLKGRYELVKELGSGGMGCVFKAIDHLQEETVAIKLLQPQWAKEPALVEDFKREVKKSQELSHPNIIRVHNYDRDGNRHFMVMAYLQGKPLSDVVKLSSPMSLDKAWPLIEAMAEGLSYAHKQDIIHRDFKPSNVFVLDETSNVKILDFGIAAKIKPTGDSTIFDRAVGGALTEVYASYEMLKGEKKAVKADDIYAFGLVVYELLTKYHPYGRNRADNVYKVQQQSGYQAPIKPSDLSEEQWQLLKQTIEIEQTNRTQDLEQWLTEFKQASQMRRPEERQPIWHNAWLPATATAGAIMLGGLLWWRLTPPPPPTASPGHDQQIWVGQTATLDGAMSSTADGGTLTYTWQLLTTPVGSNSTLAGNTSVAPQLQPDKPGTYRVQLTVTDAHEQTSQPEVVVINAEQMPTPPKANPGQDKQTIVGQIVTFDGTASTAAGGGALTYTWQLLATPPGSNSALADNTSATAQLQPDQPGTYRLQLIVTDIHGQKSQPAVVAVNAKPLLDFSTSKSQYRIGQYLQTQVKPNQDGYLNIVLIDSTGEKVKIFPNGFQKHNRVNAGQTLQIPPQGHRDMLQLAGPEGTDKLVALLSKQPLPRPPEEYLGTDGMATGLPTDVVVTPIEYQVIKK